MYLFARSPCAKTTFIEANQHANVTVHLTLSTKFKQS